MPPFAPNGFAPGHRSVNGFAAGSRSNSNGRGPSNASSINLALDNMIRSQLRVSDPRNPKEIAQALLSYYKDLPQAVAITEEAQGLPLTPLPMLSAPAPARPTSSDAEFNIAKGDVEKALVDLSTNPLTNDITPEMQGWGQSIRDAVEETGNAARQGLDPSQRDKVIAIRRQLGEYARMARFVGAMAPGMTQNFRRLGQGLDEVAAVSLVMLGESLASVGFAYGYYLLQVPLADLRQRRDAVIYALRNFAGGAQESYGPDEWPRGINAYRLLYNWLEGQGQGDLRTLLIENEIARIMDTLIARAQNGTPEGLRALGVTAQLDLERFRRLAIIAPGAMPTLPGFPRTPAPGALARTGQDLPDLSPPLVSYLEALLLFADAFKPAGGLRLLRIARPAILFYGLYNPNLLEHDTLLLDLIMIRGKLATVLDTLFPSAALRSVVPQVLLDMLTASLDRAIDLLSLGAEPGIDRGTELRAVTYWLIAAAILATVDSNYSPPSQNQGLNITGVIASPSFSPYATRLGADLNSFGREVSHLLGVDAAFQGVLKRLQEELNKVLGKVHWSNHLTHKAIREELTVQRSLEHRWRNLIRTVAPEAGNQDTIFEWLQVIVVFAAGLGGVKLPERDEPLELRALPPQYEESLSYIARSIGG